MPDISEFLSFFFKSVDGHIFNKLTLSKPTKEAGDLRNVYIRLVVIKEVTYFSFTYRYLRRDEVKNYTLEKVEEELKSIIPSFFRIATLFTAKEDVVLQVSKKNKISIQRLKPSSVQQPSVHHDREKTKIIEDSDYLVLLRVLDSNGAVIPKMADKYKQINKFLEILDSLVRSVDLPEKVKVMDMGSGKGYLTFAIYDYLKNKQNRDVTVVGVEQRAELVDFCNETAQKCHFDGLSFECGSIDSMKQGKVDILVALHACDTATDDAISKGIDADASLIICAPCCHKQIRKQIKGKIQESPILKYGIFKERQLEMVTDTIRALIMEKNYYKTNIFEFVSNEHTRKNILLVGAKTKSNPDTGSLDEKIDVIKQSYGIDYHYLEKLRHK